MISRWPCISLTLLSLYVGCTLYILTSVVRESNARRNHNTNFRDVSEGQKKSPAPAPAAEAIDSIVFVALGPASQSTSLLYALLSLREEGKWEGPVHVIVKEKGDLDCLMSFLRSDHDVSAVVALSEVATTDVQRRTLPTEAGNGATGEGSGHSKGEGGGGDFVTAAGEIVHAKMTKMHLLDLLPKELHRILYVDCDVITQRPIAPFIEAVGREWSRIDNAARPVTDRDSDAGSKSNPKVSDENLPSTILMFPDAAGHTVPICRQCDVAHSGVVAMERGRSELCLKLWLEAYMGDGEKGVKGMATDQEALDHAIRKGNNAAAFPTNFRHAVKSN